MNEQVNREEKKQSYFLIEAIGDAPRFSGGYDFVVVKWPDAMGWLEDYLDSVEQDDGRFTLRFEVREWTPGEYKEYCIANDVDVVL